MKFFLLDVWQFSGLTGMDQAEENMVLPQDYSGRLGAPFATRGNILLYVAEHLRHLPWIICVPSTD